MARIKLVAFLVMLLAVSVASSQTREASKDVKSKLFKQLLTENRELRKCMEEEEGGVRAAEEAATVEEVDLNRDGVPEYEVSPSGPCACGMVNCELYVYRQTASGYESILENASGLGIEVLKTSSNGYADLRVDARNNAATYGRSTYKYDGKQYRETSSTIVHHETGETKPSHRRVQFQRGMSSTTVQGKASIAMPDILLVGARAGQVMTLQLTAPRKSVTFSLMSPDTSTLFVDSTRSWSGPLPQNGDYTIIVDGDEKGGTYSLTVSIK